MPYSYSVFWKILMSTIFTVSATFFIGCKKDQGSSNISFYNLSVSDAQKYAVGKWKLAFAKGGFTNNTVQGKNNEYLLLSTDRIKTGNDSIGVRLDVPVIWKQVSQSTGTANCFQYTFSSSLPDAIKLIEEIRNDTLIMRDFVSDFYRYYYTKF